MTMLYGAISGRLSAFPLTWQTQSEWDTNQSEQGVHHEQPANTDWAAADEIEKGYATTLTNLRNYWPLDENSGTTANDVVGSSDGTTSGGSPGAAGILGTNAYQLNDNADHIELGADASGFISGSSAYSIVVWMKPSEWSDTEGQNNYVYGWFADFDNYTAIVNFKSSDDLSFLVENGGTSSSATTTTLPSTGSWHMFGGTFNSGSTALYVDGTQAATGSAAINSAPTDSTVTATVGNRDPSSSTSPQGPVGEVMLFDTGLTDADMQNLYDTVAGTSDFWASKKTS